MEGSIILSRFMISDGKGLYLHRDVSGNYVPVSKRKLGDVWEQRSKASNVLMNCVSKNLRTRYRVIEIEDTITFCSKSIDESINNIEIVIKPKDDVVKRLINKPKDENQLFPSSINLDNFVKFIQNSEKRKEDLVVELSDVDKEISDINHYIEFGRFNAYQGWLAFNMLKSRLKKRRKVKDELHVLTQLGECKINSASIEKVKLSMNKLNSRKYQPRKLKELFE